VTGAIFIATMGAGRLPTDAEKEEGSNGNSEEGNPTDYPACDSTCVRMARG
jgi:hypothetical protein